MKKTARSLFLICLVLLMLCSIAGCKTQDDVKNGSLKISTVPIMPYAYLNEQFDLREVIDMEDGVEYSAEVCYIKMIIDTETKEYTTQTNELQVEDLCFTPTEIEENVVTITAKRGKETASKVIYIPTTIRAEPLDNLYSSNGKLGTTDPGITKSVNIDPMYLMGEGSTTSLHVTFNSVDPHAWGNSFMDLSAPEAQEYFTDKTWENAIVTFWVYNPNELAIEFQFYLKDNIAGVTKDWNTADGPHKQIALPGQWTQMFFSLRKLGVTTRLTKNQYTTDTLKLKFRYEGYNTEESYTMDFYMDGLDVVDASMYPEIDTKYILSNESLDQGWENMAMDTGWQGVYTEYDYEIKQSDDSNCSLKAYFDNDKALTNSFICLSPQSEPELDALPDMTGGTFSGYFKFENMDARVSLDIVNDKWTTSNQVDFNLKSVGDGWYYGEVDLEDLQVGTGRNDNIIRIRLNFHGVSKNSVVYVDNCKFVYKHVEKVLESVSADWINMSPDNGSSYYSVGDADFSTAYLKGGNTVRSLKLVAPSNTTGRYTFNTEKAVKSGEISALPNMTKGTLGAWFYFGNQTPKASFFMTNSKWKGSNWVDFVFVEDAGNGWYYGAINASSLVCEEGGGTSSVYRMTIMIPKGYTVYVDNLSWKPNDESLVKVVKNDEIITSAANGTVQDKETNGSSAAWKLAPTLGTEHNWAYPKLTLDKAYSEGNYELVMDVKPVNMEDFQINLSVIDGKWLSGVTSTHLPVGQWTTVSFDIKGKAISNFNLGVEIVGGAADYAFYIDNVKLIPVEEEKAETVADDWIHMAIDEGMTNAVYSFTDQLVKAENSTVALKLDTADAKIKFTISPQWELAEKKVDMTSGILSGYFHFSDESAEKVYVAADLYASNWKHTDRLVFELESVGDGWYYGTLDTSKYDFSAADLAAGATKAEIIRIELLFRQNIIVHVDGLKFEQKAVEEIVNDEIVTAIGNNAEGAVQAEVANNSTAAWKVLPTLGTEHNWAYPQFVLDQEYAIDGHKLVMDVKPVNMDEFQINLALLNGQWLTGVVSQKIPVGEWTTVSFELTGASINSFHLGVEIVGGAADYAFYIDNVKLIPVEEEKAETVADDWIHMAIDEGMTNAVYTFTNDMVKAEDSITSLKLDTADAKIKFTISPQWELEEKKVDMTSGILSGYFHFSDESAEKVYVAADLYTGNWTHTDRLVFELESVGDGWYYGILDTSKCDFTAADLEAGASKSDIIRIQLLFRQNIIVHVDGLRFEQKIINDEIVAEISNNAEGTVQAEVTNNSATAWKVVPTLGTEHNWAYPQFVLDQEYDIDGHKLVMDVKPVNMESCQINLSVINGSWLSGVTSTFLTVDQWTTVSFDLTGSSISNFHLGMEVNGGENYAVYVDNIKLVHDETVAEDWIHMAIDEGMTNAVFSYTDELVKAEGSTSSLKLDTTDAKIKFTISPEWELAENKVDVTSGILSGYFHFSDESAEKVYAAAQLYSSNWKHTDRLVFELESVGDGWYFGTLDTSVYDFSTADLAAGATKAEVIRIELLFRQNIIVHVDGLKFEDKADRNDMFAGGIQAGGSLWSAGNNLTYVSDCTEVYGENSISAWKFSAGAANANQWAQFLMGMTQSYNMDGYYLVFDAKVEGVESQTLSMRPRTGTDGAKDPCNNTVLQLTSGWNTYTVDFSAALKSGSTVADLGVVQRIFMVFDFAANTGADRSIIIDNVRLEVK